MLSTFGSWNEITFDTTEISWGRVSCQAVPHRLTNGEQDVQLEVFIPSHEVLDNSNRSNKSDDAAIPWPKANTGMVVHQTDQTEFLHFSILEQNGSSFQCKSLKSMEGTLLKAWESGNGRAHLQEFSGNVRR